MMDYEKVDPVDYFNVRYKNETKRDTVWKAVVSWIENRFGKANTVLEIAAGRCSIINASSASIRWAIDLNPEIRNYAGSGVNTLDGDAIEKLRELEMKFDGIFVSNFFEHVSKEYASILLELCKNKLNKDGMLYIIQPNFRYSASRYFDDYTHVTIYSHISMRDFLFVNNYTVVESIPKFLPLTFESKLKLFSSLSNLYLKLPYRPLAKQMFIAARPN